MPAVPTLANLSMGVVEAVGSWMAGLPFVALWLFFLFGGMARGNALYAVGRGIAEGGRRSRFSSKFTGPGMVGAEAFVAKWGAIGVALCYLTVGFQSMVLVACGIMRMPLWRFEPAALVGSAMWATIYTTIGFAAWETTMGLAAHSTWAVVVAVLVAIAVVVWLVRRRRRHATSASAAAAGPDRRDQAEIEWPSPPA